MKSLLLHVLAMSIMLMTSKATSIAKANDTASYHCLIPTNNMDNGQLEKQEIIMVNCSFKCTIVKLKCTES